ncbi:MAG: hydantoinase B/oxoprolinase family protein, partial [Actinobacteria bacterium]|nr:hydantoinase B/oxoprolinase family protein [Actinomycetota bacterium]
GMGSTLLRAGRSAVINVARDFSCSIVTADDELLAAAEGLPVHIFGSQLQTAEMRRRHPDLRPGDAFLDNDPYTGNSHHADHTILVPVFVGDKHMFTAVAKAHQADIGNSTPTTYAAAAKDIYEEGALSFPCVQIQRDGEDVRDIIEMCRRRIRVPQQWYGDYLATLGAARTGERRLVDLVEMYGPELIEEFVREWLDYSERRMEHAIGELRSGTFVRQSQHDSIGALPAIPLKASVTVDAEARRVQIDLRDNPDCVPAGLNLTRATASNMAIAGLFGNVDPDIPANSGSFRRVEVLLRENLRGRHPPAPRLCLGGDDQRRQPAGRPGPVGDRRRSRGGRRGRGRVGHGAGPRRDRGHRLPHRRAVREPADREQLRRARCGRRRRLAQLDRAVRRGAALPRLGRDRRAEVSDPLRLPAGDGGLGWGG